MIFCPMSRVLVLDVTSAETGGQITITSTLPNGVSNPVAIFNASLSQAVHTPSTTLATFLIEANTTFSLLQNTAFTAGAAVLFAELWAL